MKNLPARSSGSYRGGIHVRPCKSHIQLFLHKANSRDLYWVFFILNPHHPPPPRPPPPVLRPTRHAKTQFDVNKWPLLMAAHP